MVDRSSDGPWDVPAQQPEMAPERRLEASERADRLAQARRVSAHARIAAVELAADQRRRTVSAHLRQSATRWRFAVVSALVAPPRDDPGEGSPEPAGARPSRSEQVGGSDGHPAHDDAPSSVAATTQPAEPLTGPQEAASQIRKAHQLARSAATSAAERDADQRRRALRAEELQARLLGRILEPVPPDVARRR